MPDFTNDGVVLPGPKVLWDGASPIEDVPDMWCSYTDYNALRDAANSLRVYVKQALAPGVYTLATITIGPNGNITAIAVGAGLTDGDKGDVVISGSGTVFTIDAGVVTVGKMAAAAANSLLGNNTGSPATPAYLTAAQARTLLGLAAIATSGSGADLTANSVANAKLAQMAAHTYKGNNTGATTDALDLTRTQVKADLAIAAGDVSGLAAVATSGAAGDVSGLATIATSGSASNLVAGTVPAARMPALTGPVTSTAGTVATAITANAVDNTMLAQMATLTVKANLTGGTANAADATIATLLAALAVRLGEFGGAADGSATMDGSTAVTGYSLAGSTYTANGYAYFGDLTINVGVTVNQHSWPGPVCKGTCTNNGHVSWDGANASGQTAGIASVATGPLPLGTAGGNGGAVNAGAGVNGTAGAANAAPRGYSTTAAAGGTGTIIPAAVNPGAAGGVGHGGGGGGTLATGGAGGGLTALSTAVDWRQKHVATVGMAAVPAGNNTKLSGSTGGGGGAGGGGVGGGVGGGAGAGASYGVSKAFTYAGSGTWTANGGNGANGANATAIASDGGGGGGAGGGGIVVFVSASTPPTASVVAGTAGNGGTGQTTGRTGGAGGGAGAGLTENFF